MKELEKDMTMLRAGMKEVGREIEFYRGQPVQHGDRSAFTYGLHFCQPVQHGDRSAFTFGLQFFPTDQFEQRSVFQMVFSLPDRPTRR
jgi:hypothetical protein